MRWRGLSFAEGTWEQGPDVKREKNGRRTGRKFANRPRSTKKSKPTIRRETGRPPSIWARLLRETFGR